MNSFKRSRNIFLLGFFWIGICWPAAASAAGPLELKISLDNPKIYRQETATYTISYKNNGPVALIQPVIETLVPDATELITNNQAETGFIFDKDRKVLRWTLPRLEPQQAGQFQFQVKPLLDNPNQTANLSLLSAELTDNLERAGQEATIEWKSQLGNKGFIEYGPTASRLSRVTPETEAVERNGQVSHRQQLPGLPADSVYYYRTATVTPAGLKTFSPVQLLKTTGQTQTVAGELITEPATLHSLGFSWLISGDLNRNAKVSPKYRPKGEANFQNGLDFMRIGGEVSGPPGQEYTSPNMLSGSLFNLKPNTEYEVELALTDPDGGEAKKTITVATRKEPLTTLEGPTLHVYPPDYTGPKTTPSYTGLRPALEAVTAGQTIVVHAGRYTIAEADKNDRRDYVLAKKGTADQPIIIKGEGEAILDGTGALTLLDTSGSSFIYLQNLVFEGADHLISGGRGELASDNLVIRNNTFRDGLHGIFCLSKNCSNFTIIDNRLIGPKNNWHPRVGDVRSFGIWIEGRGHSIGYNTVEQWWDGINIGHNELATAEMAKQPLSDQTGSNDIYNNYFTKIEDDCIQIDYGYRHQRVMRNFCTNSFIAFSVQPLYGGPGYILRNLTYNITRAPLKLNQRASGLIIAHNSLVGPEGFRASRDWKNSWINNNLFIGIGGGDGFLWTGSATPETTRLDHNGYRVKGFSRPAPVLWLWPDQRPLFGLFNVTTEWNFPTLASFAHNTGFERNAKEIDYDNFRSVPPQSGEDKPLPTLDFRLNANSSAVNSGLVMPGINDNFEASAPDLGAYELNDSPEQYGVRN